MAVPVLTECKELIADSGGAGKHRGGLGQRAVLRNLGKSPMSIYLASERVRHPCFGVVGGQSGTPGKVLKNGEPHSAKGKVVLETGDRLQVETPGGGGWGRTHERSVDADRTGSRRGPDHPRGRQGTSMAMSGRPPWLPSRRDRWDCLMERLRSSRGGYRDRPRIRNPTGDGRVRAWS